MSVPERMRTYIVGLRRGAREARIDDDHLRAVLLRVQHVQHRHRVRFGGVAADVQRALGVLHVVVRVGHRAVAPGVGYAGDRRRVADARLVVAVVRCRSTTRTCATGTPARCCACELPTQNTASGPDSLRIASSLSPTSLIACSQLILWYLPSTSFIGVFSRCSPWPCSRIDAPFAQCAPRLSGESNTGSWRTHTPFSTTRVDRAADRAVRAHGALHFGLQRSPRLGARAGLADRAVGQLAWRTRPRRRRGPSA